MRAAPSGEIAMARSLLTQKQHERANQRKHAHTNSEAIGLDQNVVVDQHDAERCRQHDGERNQENDNPVLHGRSTGRAHLSPRAPHPWRLDCARCGLFAGALVSVGCLAQVLRGLSPIGGEPDEASAVSEVAGLLGGAGAGFGVAFEDLGERHGGPHAAGGLAGTHRQARRKRRLTGCAPRVRLLG
jgi:hypothetical protein